MSEFFASHTSSCAVLILCLDPLHSAAEGTTRNILSFTLECLRRAIWSLFTSVELGTGSPYQVGTTVGGLETGSNALRCVAVLASYRDSIRWLFTPPFNDTLGVQQPTVHDQVYFRNPDNIITHIIEQLTLFLAEDRTEYPFNPLKNIGLCILRGLSFVHRCEKFLGSVYNPTIAAFSCGTMDTSEDGDADMIHIAVSRCRLSGVHLESFLISPTAVEPTTDLGEDESLPFLSRYLQASRAANGAPVLQGRLVTLSINDTQ